MHVLHLLACFSHVNYLFYLFFQKYRGNCHTRADAGCKFTCWSPRLLCSPLAGLLRVSTTKVAICAGLRTWEARLGWLPVSRVCWACPIVCIKKYEKNETKTYFQHESVSFKWLKPRNRTLPSLPVISFAVMYYGWRSLKERKDFWRGPRESMKRVLKNWNNDQWRQL